MGRAVLKSLKESTLLSFFMVCREWGLKKDIDYRYNSMASVITFSNGSEIYLKDLFAYPSDPEFDSLGSTEYTAAFLDEVSQITEKAKNIVMSRLRYKLDEYGLIPKMLMASNPAKNFAYREYYKPYRDGTLQEFRKFVPALVGDNPFISSHYISNLKKLDKNSKERLLHGNWEYDDDPTRLFEYDSIIDMFGASHAKGNIRQQYISCDVARYGDDKTVIIWWNNLHMQKIWSFPKTSTREIRLFLEKIMHEQAIPKSHVVIDEDGVGGGVVDEMPGVKGFVNNSTPIKSKKSKLNYANLKAQCYFKLADHVNGGKITSEEPEIRIKDALIEDLEQIKAKDVDKDTKVRVLTKEEIKEELGRSPDYADAMMMRMYFELGATYRPHIAN